MEKYANLSTEFNDRLAKIKTIDKRLSEITEPQKHIGTYSKTKEICRQYRVSGEDADFFEVHRADITLHLAAKKHFDSLGLAKLPSMESLKREYAALRAEKKRLYSGYQELRDQRMKLLTAKGNVQRVLGIG